MKTLNLKHLFTIVISFTMFSLFAQSETLNLETSTIHWLGKKIVGQHDGFIKLKSAEITEENNTITAGSFEVDMTSITCTDLENEKYNQKLVGHLKSDDFFGVEAFPTSKLVITEASVFENGVAKVKGDLTIKGKTNAETFELKKTDKGYTTQLEIDRTKYGVEHGSASLFSGLGDKAIKDIFTLDIELVSK